MTAYANRNGQIQKKYHYLIICTKFINSQELKFKGGGYLKLDTKLIKIIGQYRNILAIDGIVDKKTLIEMLKLDEEIDSEVDYSYLADKILDNIEELKATGCKPYSSMERKKRHDERMELYKQELVDSEIAEILGVNQTTIWHWRKKNGLPSHGLRRKK